MLRSLLSVLLCAAGLGLSGGARVSFVPDAPGSRRSLLPPIDIEAEDDLDSVQRLEERLCQHVSGISLVLSILDFMVLLERYEVEAQFAPIESFKRYVQMWGIHVWASGCGLTRYGLTARRGAARRNRGGMRAPRFNVVAYHTIPRLGRTLLKLLHPDAGADVFISLGHEWPGDDEMSIAVTFCTGLSEQSMYHAWEDERCFDRLGAASNASVRALWGLGHCEALATRCTRLWSYTGAASRLPCLPETISTMSARVSLDQRSLVLHSTMYSADYLWAFGDGQAPRLLQESAPLCRGDELDASDFDDRCADYSGDGAFYATRNRSHVLLYEVPSGRLSLELGLATRHLKAWKNALHAVVVRGPLDS